MRLLAKQLSKGSVEPPSPPARRSYHECDACNYRYNIRRTALAVACCNYKVESPVQRAAHRSLQRQHTRSRSR